MLGDSAQNGNHPLRVSAIGHPYRDDEAPHRIGVRPVENGAGDELRVGDDQAGPVKRLDLGRAYIDPPDETLLPVDDDSVPHLDRALDEKNDAGDEIVEDRLQPKANAE